MTDAAAAWQKGFTLERLKEFGSLFAQAHKPLVFGAFGLTKERDVAEALSKNHAIWTGSPRPQAVALFSIAKVASEQSDFAQRKFTIEPGSVVVKSFATEDVPAGRKVLAALRQRAGEATPIWVEIFEEDRNAKAAVEDSGFGYVTSKISAGSEIKGMYLNGALSPLPELGPDELATQLVLRVGFLSVAELAAIRAELAEFEGEFAQHYSDYNKRKSWTAFALRGYDDDPAFIIKPSEMSKAWKAENPARLKAESHWTKAAASFPATRKAMDRLGVGFDRVRFMRLRAKDGELSRHADITDREAGVADGYLSRLHIPIATSDAVTFYGWDARGRCIETKWPERALCYLDQRKPHAVKNTDPELNRIHLVADCVANARLRKMIASAAAVPE